MLKQAKVIRLFVASPGDLDKERKRLDSIVEQINSSSITNNGYLLELKKWETHTYPAAGRPQKKILEQIGGYDIFIGIMWKRFGSPTGKAGSGTEEEFRDALNRFKNADVKHIAFYFCERKIPLPRNDDEITQLRNVLNFRKELEKERSIYFKTYKTIDEFDREARNLIERLTSKFTVSARNSSDEEYDVETGIEIARRLSSLGKYEDSINALLPLTDYCLSRKDYLKLTEIEHLIALQYRHGGHFTEALEHYAQSEIYIMKAAPLPINAKILYLRIKAGRIMVEEYLVKGECVKAYESYEKLKGDISDLMSDPLGSDSVRDMVRVYELHLLRQQAEMLRISGQYNEALRIFSNAYQQYDFSQSLPKAYALVGIGDSLRLIGNPRDALEKYLVVEKYAIENKDNRLLSRVIRNKLMALYELENNSTDALTATLQSLSMVDGGDSRFNRIYYLLASGMISLTQDQAEAENCFTEAIALTETKQGSLRIENLHGTFGLAECKRMRETGDVDPEIYSHLYSEYKKMGLSWGAVRTLVVLNSLLATKGNQKKIDGSLPMEGGELRIWKESKRSEVGRHTVIFRNIP